MGQYVSTTDAQANAQGIYISVVDQNGAPLDPAYFDGANFDVTFNGAVIPSGSMPAS